jgi:hypothetical protein
MTTFQEPVDALNAYDLDALMDARDDARREEWDDAHPADMECSECGAEWWGDVLPATRLDPAEARRPDCPVCG